MNNEIDKNKDGNYDRIEIIDYLIRAVLPVTIVAMGFALAITGIVLDNEKLTSLGTTAAFGGSLGSGLTITNRTGRK